eukprot:Pompholyxophrys_punicea_v1_NODE_58_length_4147_cov_5.424487.p1 type:complete len:340 gc:universal NODE_58_length_4147_cov_5.424487:2949-3968(+)
MVFHSEMSHLSGPWPQSVRVSFQSSTGAACLHSANLTRRFFPSSVFSSSPAAAVSLSPASFSVFSASSPSAPSIVSLPPYASSSVAPSPLTVPSPFFAPRLAAAPPPISLDLPVIDDLRNFYYFVDLGDIDPSLPFLPASVPCTHVRKVASQPVGGLTSKGFWVPLSILGHEILALLDTGAEISFLSSVLCQTWSLTLQPSDLDVHLAVTGTTSSYEGFTDLLNVKCGRNFMWSFGVMDLAGDLPCLIGLDLFENLNFRLSNIPSTFPLVSSESSSVPTAFAHETSLESPPPPAVASFFQANLSSLLELNQATRGKFCNLEESVVCLDTQARTPTPHHG